MTRFALATATGLLSAAAPVPRGAPVALTVENASPIAMECHAIAGHWYGFDFTAVAPGGLVTLRLMYDRASGMVAMLNARDQPVPLEYVYCGHVGDAWRTRAVLPMRERLAEPAAIVCRERLGALQCD